MRLRNHDMHPFVDTDVWQLLLTRAKTHAGRPFIVWQSFDQEPVTVTFDRLARDAAAIGAGLAARGVGIGDRVLVHLDNSPEFVTAWFACASVGAVAVSTNTRSTVPELCYFADDSNAVGAITQPKYAAAMEKAAPTLRFLIATGHDGGVPAESSAESFAALHGDPDSLPRRPTNPLLPNSVQYTSGTTARPKGVVWTHANALWAAYSNMINETLRPDDCHLVYLPLFHTNALAYSMLPSLWVGARLVLVPKWSTSRFADISVRHRCTWLAMMMLSFSVLMDTEPPAGHAYRMFGGLCDTPLDDVYGVKSIGWFGMTETVSHPILGNAFLPNRPMSMGRPVLNYDTKIVREDGSPVDLGETGELLVRGVRGLSMFDEYLNQPEATAQSFDAEGWFATGDLVTPHPDGCVSFENRAKDMLRVGAENVSAAEVERVIQAVPGVVEVGVVGRPDPFLEEVPVAFVRTSTDDPRLFPRIEGACADMLADFKRPRAIYRIEQFPRSTLAKINKIELRAVADPDADRVSAERRWVDDAAADPSGDAP